MLNLAPLLFALCLLTACSPGVDASGEGEGAAAPADSAALPGVDQPHSDADQALAETNQPPAEPSPVLTPAKPPLDLSLPELADVEFTQTPGEFLPKRFDTPSLFSKEKDDPVSLSVKPNLVLGEKLLSVPEIDGGSVSVQVKTK